MMKSCFDVQADSDFELKVIYELDGGETMFTPEILAGIQGEELGFGVLTPFVQDCWSKLVNARHCRIRCVC